MGHRLIGKTVCVTDMGYVGLPLVLAFPGHPGVIGFDVDLARSPIEVMGPVYTAKLLR